MPFLLKLALWPEPCGTMPECQCFGPSGLKAKHVGAKLKNNNNYK